MSRQQNMQNELCRHKSSHWLIKSDRDCVYSNKNTSELMLRVLFVTFNNVDVMLSVFLLFSTEIKLSAYENR
jgi:hypothetical protein